jgi:hypothetical protein
MVSMIARAVRMIVKILAKVRNMLKGFFRRHVGSYGLMKVRSVTLDNYKIE